MNCPHCGSTAVQPSGTCSTCGRSAGVSTDATALHYPPPVDPFNTSSSLLVPDPLAPYGSPAEPYTPPAEPHPAPAPPTGPQPASGQPYPTSAPPYGNTGSYGSQAYPAQPYPAQPYPGRPGQGQPGQQPYPYSYTPQQSTGQGFTITAYVLAAIAVFAYPIVVGLAAIFFAAVARRRGERNAALAMKIAVAGILLGFLFGYVVDQLL